MLIYLLIIILSFYISYKAYGLAKGAYFYFWIYVFIGFMINAIIFAFIFIFQSAVGVGLFSLAQTNAFASVEKALPVESGFFILSNVCLIVLLVLLIIASHNLVKAFFRREELLKKQQNNYDASSGD